MPPDVWAAFLLHPVNSDRGLTDAILLGTVGGIVDGRVVGLIGLGGGGLIWSILVAILGAVILDLDYQAY